MNNKQGWIQLILGPMFSGKTSELMRLIKRFTISERKCLVLNYAQDNRYSGEEMISTHDRQHFKALKVMELFKVMNQAQEYDVIAIDEGQFFQDIPEFCEKLANSGKIVIVAALDGTFERKAFNRVLELVPICEKLKKLTAVCWYCKRDNAAFTKRTTNSQEGINQLQQLLYKQVELIGGDDIYKPSCRDCFNYNADNLNQKISVCDKENINLNLSINQQDRTAKKQKIIMVE